MVPCIVHCKLTRIAYVYGFSTPEGHWSLNLKMHTHTRIDPSLGLPANVYFPGMCRHTSAPCFVFPLTPMLILSRISVMSRSFPYLLRQNYDLSSMHFSNLGTSLFLPWQLYACLFTHLFSLEDHELIEERNYLLFIA